MEKSTFKFVFPKKSMEYEALANPMHIRAAAAMAMSEEKTDLCMVYFSDTLQFICVYNKENDEEMPFKYYFEDKQENHEVIIMIAGSDTIDDFNSDTIDDFMNEHQSSDYSLVKEKFNSAEESRAFMKGIGVFCDGQHQDYTSITEEMYNTLEKRED